MSEPNKSLELHRADAVAAAEALVEPRPMTPDEAIRVRVEQRRQLLDDAVERLRDRLLPNGKLREVRHTLELAERLGDEIGALLEDEDQPVPYG